MYTEIILYILNQKGNIMKSLLVILSTVVAMSAMATEAVKPVTAPTSVTVTAPAAPNKNETKPVKSQTKVEAKETKAK